MIKLRLLRYFRTVVEQGSISAASEVLHIAQPPLSKAMRQLEEQSSVKLFDRSNRGMTPTEAGRYLYQRAGDLLQLASHVNEEMLAFSEGQRGVVRIGTVMIGMTFVAEMIRTLRQHWPDLSFSLHQGDTRHLEELLRHRLIDAALVHLPLTMADGAIGITTLAQPCFRALCRPDSSLARLPMLTLRHLAGYPLVLMRRKSGSGMYEKILECFASAGITPNILAESTDVPMMQQLARDDLAIALVPQLSQSQAEEGLMSIPVPELDAVADKLALIYWTQQAQTAVLRPVVNYFTALSR